VFTCHRHARALAACLPRQDHVWLTTDASFRFQASTKTNSTKYPKLESTENPCSKCQFCSRDTQPHLNSPSPRGQTSVWTRIGSRRFFVGLCVWWVMLREKRQFRVGELAGSSRSLVENIDSLKSISGENSEFVENFLWNQCFWSFKLSSCLENSRLSCVEILFLFLINYCEVVADAC